MNGVRPAFAISRRSFLSGLILAPMSAFAADQGPLLQKCKTALLTTAGMCLVYLLGDEGENIPIGDADKRWLDENIFGQFTANLAPFLRWIASSKFIVNEFTAGKITFYLPHSADAGSAFHRMLQGRIDALPALSLKGSRALPPHTYTFAKPKLLSGPMPSQGKVACQVGTEEEDQIATLIPPGSDPDQTATVMVAAGAIRKILLASVYAYDIAPRRMGLWGSLSLSSHENLITAEASSAQYAISLLPLLRTPDATLYNSSFPPSTPKSAMSRYLNVYTAFKALNDGGSLPTDIDPVALDRDIEMLDAVSEIFFNTMYWVLSHEVSHALYRHRLPDGTCNAATLSLLSHAHELAADEAATIALFMTTVTNTLNSQRTWVADWYPGAVSSPVLATKLAWFDRMAAIGVACNVAMPLLHAKANCFYPGYQQRWSRNVAVWNACALAFSKISQYPAA